MRVLIVEDDKVLREGLSHYLHDAGYQADAAATGTEADAILVHEDYDLVILDIGLPGLDGLEVLRRCEPTLKALSNSSTSFPTGR